MVEGIYELRMEKLRKKLATATKNAETERQDAEVARRNFDDARRNADDARWNAEYAQRSLDDAQRKVDKAEQTLQNLEHLGVPRELIEQARNMAFAFQSHPINQRGCSEQKPEISNEL